MGTPLGWAEGQGGRCRVPLWWPLTVPTLLGTPTEEQWPAMAKLPDYKVRAGDRGGQRE